MAKLTGTSLAGGSVNYERVENDYYATAPTSTYGLFNVEDFEGDFLEPCCGEGHISKVIKNKYPDFNVESSDLIDRGYGQGGVDFLTTEYDKKYDNIVTNPPYKLAKEFIEKSLSITNKKVAMFLKIQFLEGIGRYDFFKNTPLKHVHVFSGRQDPWRSGEPKNPKTNKKWGSTMCFAWFVWEHGYEGEPIIKWIHPDLCKIPKIEKIEKIEKKIENDDDFWK